MTTNKSAPLNVAIVGCGDIVRKFHCPALKHLRSNGLFRVAALVDPEIERAKALQKHFREAVCFCDISQLSAPSIDLAVVATPPHLHAALSIALLNSGINVLCEKPMAIDLVEAKSMLDSANENGLLLAVGLVQRFFSAVQVIQDILKQGIIGQAESITITRGGTPGKVTDWRYRKQLAGGGILMEVGIHHIDEMIWWLGYPEEIVYEDDALGGLESNCQLQMRFKSGARGSLRLSRGINLRESRLIQCSSGWLKTEDNPDILSMGFDNCQYSLKGLLSPEDSGRRVLVKNSQASSDLQPYIEQLRNVGRAILGLENLMVPGSQGIKSLEAIEHCYRARTLINMSWLAQDELAMAFKISQSN